MSIVHHYGIEVDSEKPITGVFQNNHCEWLNEDAYEGFDLNYTEHKEECHEEEHDNCAPESGTMLIGFRYTDASDQAWYWFPNQVMGYEPDPDAEYSAIVGEVYTQVVRSKWTIRCALCSPCYPGQGDANTSGDFLAYSLPPEIIGEGSEPELIERIKKISD